jgi:AcrR family transcriptional regulator
MTAAPTRRPPGRPRAAGHGSTRARILAAAEPLFSERGYAGTSMQALRAAVGVSNATILHHFQSKRKLYSEVLARIADSVAEVAAPARPDGDPAEQVAAMTTSLLDWSRRNPRSLRIVIRELLENPERLAEARRWHLAGFVHALRGPVARLHGAGRLGGLDPDALVIVLIGAVSYFVIAAPTMERLLAWKDPGGMEKHYRRTLADIVRRCIAPGPRRGKERT